MGGRGPRSRKARTGGARQRRRRPILSSQGKRFLRSPRRPLSSGWRSRIVPDRPFQSGGAPTDPACRAPVPQRRDAPNRVIAFSTRRRNVACEGLQIGGTVDGTVTPPRIDRISARATGGRDSVATRRNHNETACVAQAHTMNGPKESGSNHGTDGKEWLSQGIDSETDERCDRRPTNEVGAPDGEVGP